MPVVDRRPSPLGRIGRELATRLGVEMGKSTTFDPANAETGIPAQLIFSRVNELLGNHVILTGRDGSERIDRVLTFAGQSLKGPRDSVALLQALAFGRRPAATRPYRVARDPPPDAPRGWRSHWAGAKSLC